MDESQLVPAALKASGHARDTAVVSPNYNKISDNIRRLAPHGLQCTMFCGGTHCKYENPDNWTSEDYAIQGIFSNCWGIKSIINLQTPKEHASCGPPLEESGYTYDPAIFMENNSLGRTGVLIACYLIYILRVRANDAINYIRLKRPGSVQTRGQILCIQEFAQFILPLCVVYNLKEHNNQLTKEKKNHELSLPKCLNNQRVVLHGYEERSLKHLPKVVYRLCERILILCNCWCEEFAVGNVPFTNYFLVTKLNLKNQKDANTQYTETRSQQTLSNSSTKGGNAMPQANGVSHSSTELSSNTSTVSENGIANSNMPLSTASASSVGVELLNDTNEAADGNLRENKCFQLLTQLQCGNTHEIPEPYSVEQVADALLTDYNTLEESTKKYIKQFEIDFNSNQATWSRLKTEKNLIVLAALLYDWLEGLKFPVVNREDLSNIVIYSNRPETCLQKLDIDSQYLLEFLIRFLTHLQPCVKATTLNLLKRFAASLTQKTVSLKNIRLPVGKEFQKLRDGTLDCVLNFMYSLYKICEANRTSSAVSSSFYELCSGSPEVPSPRESDDDSDVECPANC